MAIIIFVCYHFVLGYPNAFETCVPIEAVLQSGRGKYQGLNISLIHMGDHKNSNTICNKIRVIIQHPF